MVRVLPNICVAIESVIGAEPLIFDVIVAAAESDPGLMDAIRDYEQACERMNDAQAEAEDRELCAEIRRELAAELEEKLSSDKTLAFADGCTFVWLSTRLDLV